jgi:hypothetical protein
VGNARDGTWVAVVTLAGEFRPLGLVRLEYRKVETYRTWAQQFETAKYDLYAVLGWKGQTLIWGNPSRFGPQELQSVDLNSVEEIRLLVDDHPVAWPLTDPPLGKQIQLEILPQHYQIPFTEMAMATAFLALLRYSNNSV